MERIDYIMRDNIKQIAIVLVSPATRKYYRVKLGMGEISIKRVLSRALNMTRLNPYGMTFNLYIDTDLKNRRFYNMKRVLSTHGAFLNPSELKKWFTLVVNLLNTDYDSIARHRNFITPRGGVYCVDHADHMEEIDSLQKLVLSYNKFWVVGIFHARQPIIINGALLVYPQYSNFILPVLDKVYYSMSYIDICRQYGTLLHALYKGGDKKLIRKITSLMSKYPSTINYTYSAMDRKTNLTYQELLRLSNKVGFYNFGNIQIEEE